MGIITEVLSLRRGRWSYRLLANLILLIAGVAFGGITLYIALHLNVTTRLIMLAIYGAGAALLLYESYTITLNGRKLFLSVANGYALHKNELFSRGTSRPVGQRSMLSYLLLPRFEALAKSSIAIIAFCLAAYSSDSWQWKRFLLLWIVLEFFVYAARYQWNDLRDFEGDQQHPAHDWRGRLPAGPNPESTAQKLALSMIVLLLRLIAAALIGYATHTLAQVGLIIATVFAVAVCYEFMRTRLPTEARSSQQHKSVFAAVLVWLAVGPGYAVRGAVGLLAAHVGWASPALYLGIAALMSLGIMVVLLSWLLDISSYFLISADGTWHMKADQSLKRPHLRLLLPCAPVSIGLDYEEYELCNPQGRANFKEAKESRFLEQGRAGWAPWNVALAFAAILAPVFAIALPSSRQVTAGTYYVVVAVSLGGAVLMIYSSRQWQRWAVAAGFAVLIAFASLLIHAPGWLSAGASWLAVSISYVAFHGMSFLDMTQALPKLRGVSTKLTLAVSQMVLGSATLGYLRPQPTRDSPVKSAVSSSLTTFQAHNVITPLDGGPVPTTKDTAAEPGRDNERQTKMTGGNARPEE